MAATQTRYKQDMPPRGGFGSVPFARVPQRSYIGNVALLVAVSVANFYLYQTKLLPAQKRLKFEAIETYDTNIALQPFMVAERDRAYLKQLRKNFEEEQEIMKDVPNWKAGTLFGEKVYRTTPDNYHIDPITEEFYAHTDAWKAHKQWNFVNMKWYFFTSI